MGENRWRARKRSGVFFLSCPWILGFLAFYLIPMLASFGFSLYNINLADSSDVVSVRLTQQSVDTLQKKGIPDATITKVVSLRDQEFKTQADFFAAITQQTGAELSTADKDVFWEAAKKNHFVGLSNWKRLLFQDEDIWPRCGKFSNLA